MILNPPADWNAFFSSLRILTRDAPVPSINQVAGEIPDPFRVLISTIISLRTKDEVTIAASERLFARADTPGHILNTPESEIAELIFPCGFYKTKAVTIRTVSQLLIERHGGMVPDSFDALTALPGVGAKTANLTLGLAFGIPSICVDTHVHRIPNRMGWIASSNPEETETDLEQILPREFWIEINSLMVAFGKTVCVPVSPWCGKCPFFEDCPKAGVKKQR